MSVMLRSTNPQAVGEMEPGRDRRVPYKNQAVIFHTRPGEGVAGELTVSAFVDKIIDDDHVNLAVRRGYEDWIERRNVPRKTEQNPVHSWSFNDWDEKNYQPDAEPPKPEVSAAAFNALAERVMKLEAKNKALEGELSRLSHRVK